MRKICSGKCYCEKAVGGKCSFFGGGCTLEPCCIFFAPTLQIGSNAHRFNPIFRAPAVGANGTNAAQAHAKEEHMKSSLK